MSDDQFKDLKKYLDERFDAQELNFEKRFDERDARFAAIDKRFDQQDAEFAAIDERFDEFEAKLDAKADRKDLERIYDALDAILKNQEIEQQERAAIIAQLDRHERWHHQTADHLGLTLTYE